MPYILEELVKGGSNARAAIGVPESGTGSNQSVVLDGDGKLPAVDGSQLTNLPSGAPLDQIYPVGSIYISTASTSPATLFGMGTWAAFGAGRVLVGLDSNDTDFDTAKETGGAKTITLTEAQIPSHTHTQNSHNHTQDAHTHTQNAHNHTQRYHSATTGGLSGPTTAPDTSSNTPTNYGLVTADTTAVNQNTTATNQAATATNQNTGGGGSHSNVQPYIVVYMWERTA